MDFTPEQFSEALLNPNATGDESLGPMFNQMMMLTTAPRQRFIAKLISLPSFCKTHLLCVLRSLDTSSDINPYQLTLGKMVESPLFHRWVRESGEDELVMKVLVAYIGLLDRFLPNCFMDTDNAPAPTVKFLAGELPKVGWVLLFVSEILLGLPPSIRNLTWLSLLPTELAASAGVKLIRANQFFSSRQSFKRSDGLTTKEDQSLHRVATCILVISSFVTGNPTSKISKLHRQSNSGRHWLSCGAIAVLDVAGDEATTKCAVLRDGEVMMTCGRCKSVRYCSADHQKVDWRRHKHECVASQWDIV